MYIGLYQRLLHRRRGGLFTRALTIDHTLCGGSDSANCTIPVALQETWLRTIPNGGQVANANGYDITFSTDVLGLSPLSWQQITYDAATGKLLVWVKMANISASADTVFYMHYNNAAITTFQGGSTGSAWHSNYRSVMHLEESAAPYLDSTTNTNNSIGGVGPTPTFGKLPYSLAQAFNGSSSYLQVANSSSLDLSDQLTLAFWVRYTSGTTLATILIKQEIRPQFGIQVSASDNLFFTSFSGNSGLTTGTIGTAWKHIVLTANNTTGCKIYIDGALDLTDSAILSANFAEDMYIGSTGATMDLFNGILDEIQILATQWSADTVLTMYNAQNDPATFITVGAVI